MNSMLNKMNDSLIEHSTLVLSPCVIFSHVESKRIIPISPPSEILGVEMLLCTFSNFQLYWKW